MQSIELYALALNNLQLQCAPQQLEAETDIEDTFATVMHQIVTVLISHFFS